MLTVISCMQPPSEPRGPIVDYIVQFKQKHEDDYVSQNVGSNETYHLIHGLKEFQE